MSFERMAFTAQMEYDIAGEEAMDSLLGPDETMMPFQVRVEFSNGKLAEVIVFGWRIGKNNRVGRSSSARRFKPEDVADAPAWVRELVRSATLGASNAQA